MAVVSTPVKAIDNNGDYSFIIDFTSNETLTHEKCFKQAAPDLARVLSNEESIDYICLEEKDKPELNVNLGESLKNTLSSLGEKVTQSQVQTFLIQNGNSDDIGKLVTLWFQNRNRVD